jgi:chromosomal replication initiation ATPase DnaA
MNENIPEEIDRFYRRKRLRWVLGRSEFVQWVKDQFCDLLKHPEIPESRELAPSIDQILVAVCDVFDTTIRDLTLSVRGKPNPARSSAIYMARKRGGLPLMEIGLRFGLRRHSSVESVILSFEAILKRNRSLREKLKKVEASLK